MLKGFRFLIFALLIISLATCIAACDKITPLIDKVEDIYNDKFGDEGAPSDEECEHNYVGVVTYPTCVEQGYITFTCACGDSYIDNYIMATGHTEVIDAAVPATCSTTGLTEGKHCSVCDAVIVAQRTVAMVDHDYVNYICRVCGATAYSKGLEYISKGDGTCYVFGIGTCTDTDIVIPPVSPDGETVVEIGSNAFAQAYRITSITILDGVTTIGENAFYDCPNLTSVIIPDTVTSICGGAFWNCKHLTDITIPDSVTSLAGGVFAGCSSLTSMTIPDGVTFIGGYTFYACSNLSSVSIGKGVGYIDYAAFLDCYRLTSITIPGSVTSIGDVAFSGCSSLSSVTIGNGVTSIGYDAFENCLSLTGIVIPDSVTSIGDYAFEGCSSLSSVTIGNGVTSIGDRAFVHCSSLTGVYITDIAKWRSILFVNEYSNPLYYAHNLYLNGKLVTNLTILEGAISISRYAFCGCSSLTSIVIPDSVTFIGDYAFSYCSNLKSVVIPETVIYVGWGAFAHPYDYSVHTIIYCEAESQPDGWSSEWNSDTRVTNMYYRVVWAYTGDTGITEDGFSWASIKTGITITGYVGDEREVVFPSKINGLDVTAICDNAFNQMNKISGSTSITVAVIPDSVTHIGYCAFAYCWSLTSVSIGNGVASIGDSAFHYCDSLTCVTIGNGVTSIGDYAFASCSSFKTINYRGTKEQWEAISKGDNWSPYAVKYTIVYNYNG